MDRACASTPARALVLAILAFPTIALPAASADSTAAINVEVVEGVASPYFNGHGLSLIALGGYLSAEDRSATDANYRCRSQGDEYLCSVTHVVIFGRNGTTGDAYELTTLSAATDANDPQGYRYGVDTIIPIGPLDRYASLQVRASAIVEVPTGAPLTVNTSWVQVVSAPAYGFYFNLGTDSHLSTTGVVDLNVTLDTQLSAAVVNATYRLLGRSGPNVAWDVIASEAPFNISAPSGTPRCLLNFTASVGEDEPLSRGQYRVEATALADGANAAISIAEAAWEFGVAVSPLIDIPATQVDSPLVEWESDPAYPTVARFRAPRQFNLSLSVDLWPANIDGDDNFTFVLTSRAGDQRFEEGDAGFAATMTSAQAADTNTNFAFRVELPAGVVHDRTYFLNVTATTDAIGADGRRQDATGVLLVMADLEPPQVVMSSSVSSYALNGTFGAFAATAHHNVFFGRPFDNSSGVSRVDVRVYDQTGNRTWKNETGNWTEGLDANAWAPAQLVRNSTDDLWWVFGPKHSPTEPFYTYIRQNRYHLVHVAVRAQDAVGNVLSPRTFGVSFDAELPMISDFAIRFDNNTNLNGNRRLPMRMDDHQPLYAPFVSYLGRSSADGGNGTLEVVGTVAGDTCIVRVDLVIAMPSGHTERARLIETPRSECATAESRAYVLSRATTPFPGQALNASGTIDTAGMNRAHLEVFDHSGNVVRSAERYWFRVLDDAPARLANASFVPNVVGDGGGARLVFNVTENHEMAGVRVTLLRHGEGGRDDTSPPIGVAYARPCNTDHGIYPRRVLCSGNVTVSRNGTGTWTIDTRAINATHALEPGTYTAHVLAVDRAGNVPEHCADLTRAPDGEGGGGGCTTVALNVVPGSQPRITLVTPSWHNDFVGGVARIDALVSGRGVRPGEISLATGTDSLALIAVRPTFLPLTEGQITIGYRLLYNQTLPPHAMKFAFRITARNDSGVDSIEREVWVDRQAPTATAQFEGDVVVGSRIYVSRTSRLLVDARDGESGVARTLCAADRAPFEDCDTPLRSGGREGARTVDFSAEDRVGNRAANQTISIQLDDTPPEVAVVDEGHRLVVRATDIGAGMGKVIVHYSPDPADADHEFATMQMRELGGDLYEALLPEDARIVRFYVEASDRVGNIARLFAPDALGTISHAVDSPQPPRIRVTSPEAGGRYLPPISIRWSLDAQGADNTTVGLMYAGPETAGRIIASGLEGALRQYDWVPQNLSDGTYVLTIRASGRGGTTEDSVAFVLRTADPVRVIARPPPFVDSGTMVNLTLQVQGGSAASNVAVQVFRDGTPVGKPVATMRGPEGRHMFTYVPRTPGHYELVAELEYLDGTREAPLSVSTFDVDTPAMVRFENETPLGSLGILTAAIAVSAILLHRRRPG